MGKTLWERHVQISAYTLEGWETDKYNSHIARSLQGFDKLYGRLIAYIIFEINFNTQWNNLKIYLEDFNQIVGI